MVTSFRTGLTGRACREAFQPKYLRQQQLRRDRRGHLRDHRACHCLSRRKSGARGSACRPGDVHSRIPDHPDDHTTETTGPVGLFTARGAVRSIARSEVRVWSSAGRRWQRLCRGAPGLAPLADRDLPRSLRGHPAGGVAFGANAIGEGWIASAGREFLDQMLSAADLSGAGYGCGYAVVPGGSVPGKDDPGFDFGKAAE